ncbi:hypothetical protein BT67DRAFT_14608 [Trichocladium antarcticum]|uniref:Uncharacterized protein n=1 Tax=Trichocladium antarcticum TaxID=1450529 RepID=A0AAN6ZHG4_9PEZI|nr:hypothetical protein BT67DRAFT_14608 [Trichocladium antarcticum]
MPNEWRCDWPQRWTNRPLVDMHMVCMYRAFPILDGLDGVLSGQEILRRNGKPHRTDAPSFGRRVRTGEGANVRFGLLPQTGHVTTDKSAPWSLRLIKLTAPSDEIRSQLVLHPCRPGRGFILLCLVRSASVQPSTPGTIGVRCSCWPCFLQTGWCTLLPSLAPAAGADKKLRSCGFPSLG